MGDGKDKCHERKNKKIKKKTGQKKCWVAREKKTSTVASGRAGGRSPLGCRITARISGIFQGGQEVHFVFCDKWFVYFCAFLKTTMTEQHPAGPWGNYSSSSAHLDVPMYRTGLCHTSGSERRTHANTHTSTLASRSTDRQVCLTNYCTVFSPKTFSINIGWKIKQQNRKKIQPESQKAKPPASQHKTKNGTALRSVTALPY